MQLIQMCFYIAQKLGKILNKYFYIDIKEDNTNLSV